MKYIDKIKELRLKNNLDYIMDFLESIFKAEHNQTEAGKATDFLYDDDDNDFIRPSQFFDNIVDGFRPEEDIEEKVAKINRDFEEYSKESDSLIMKFKPFNSLQFTIEDESEGKITIKSGYYTNNSNEFKSYYGLDVTIIDDDDSHEEDAYDLKSGSDYNITSNDEKINCNELYYDLKVTIFSKYILELTEALFNNKEFVKRTKSVPFTILISSDRYRKNTWIYKLLEISEPEMKGSIYKHIDPTPEECFSFYYSFRNDKDSPEYKELINNCLTYKNSFNTVLTSGEEALESGMHHLLTPISSILWELLDSDKEAIIKFQSKILSKPFSCK